MVYVDDPIWKLGRMKMCHMIADDLDELYEMVDKIEVDRRWFQGNASFPHFDISKGKRELAIKFGALPMDKRQFIKKIRELRSK